MEEVFDVIVIGAGPAGSTTARFAARSGLSVLLVDKRQELGAPIQCSGAVSRHALEEAEVRIDDEYIHEDIFGFGIYNEAGERTTIDYRLLKPNEYGTGAGQKPLGYVVDRRRFDRFLVMEAERSGVTVSLKTEGVNVKIIDDDYCDVSLIHFNEPKTIRAKVVVGADGLQSRVAKWFGMSTHMKMSELASCLQFIVDQVETEGLLENSLDLNSSTMMSFIC